MRASGERRGGELGLLKGCCAGLVTGGLLLAVAAYLLIRALSQPDVGAAPRGPAHGATPSAIATTLAAQAAASLVTSPHATVTLSEQDLTVLATAENPEPEKFREPQARIRDGRLVVSAASSLGPFDTTTTVTLSVAMTRSSDGIPGATATVLEVDLGRLSLPDWARATFDPRGNGTISLDQFLSDPALKVARQDLDCVRLADSGLVLSFHRPGVAADPTACGS